LARRRRSRSRRKKSHDLTYLIIGGVAAYAVLVARLGAIFVVALWIVVLMIWVMFFMDTYCDYDLGTRGCSRRVYGKLRGCGQHDRLKRDAVWTVLRTRNPGTRFRLTWGKRDEPGRRLGRALLATEPGITEHDNSRSAATGSQGVYGLTMWIFTAVSAGAAVLAVVLQK